MNCRRVRQLLPEDLDGFLREREAARVTAHLRKCSDCRRRRDALAAFESEVLATAEWQPVSSSDLPRGAIDRWITERVALPSEERVRLLTLRRRPAPWLASMVVATAVVLIGLGLRERQHGRMSRPRGIEMTRRTDPGQRAPASRLRPPHAQHARRRRSAPWPSVPHRSEGGRAPSSARRSASTNIDNPESARLRPTGPRRRPPSLNDLADVNGDPAVTRRLWVSRYADAWDTLETTLRQTDPIRDDFVQVSFPRLASASDEQALAAVESYRREAAVVDTRLAREVSLQQKATALADLCERLRSDTGIQLAAGPSVADEKVTLFCEQQPLRDVMRQLSRPFGYTWLRSGKASEYKYELVQDLRSQLLEEELRNRDRNAALLALDREMQRYRKYLSLSPDEALARAGTAVLEEKNLLEKLAGRGWGPVQMYFRLSPQDLAALRAGQTLTFSQEPKPGEQLVPSDVARGVLQAMRAARVRRRDGTFEFGDEKKLPDGLRPADVPEARALVTATLHQSELGRFAFDGASGFFIFGGFNYFGDGPYAVGLSPSVLKPNNGAANAKLAGDPALRQRVSVRPQSSCQPDAATDLSPSPSPVRGGEPPSLSPSGDRSRQREATPGAGGGVPPSKVTSADALETVHRACGLPIVADYYTRLYPVSAVSVQNMPLFDALNRLADPMRLRWNKEASWLQLRSTSYYDDRFKEVPNRLLTRWAAARRKHGILTLDELAEIAQLSDAQLDATEMAEGARECWGLAEWEMVRGQTQRPHFRYLASLTSAQRQAAMSAAGLPFAQMSLTQQQQFIVGTQTDRLHSQEAMASAVLRVEHTQPGWFEWVVQEPLSRGFGPIKLPPVRDRPRAAALQAARRIDPQVDPAKIVPTELAVTILYTLGNPETGGMTRELRATAKDVVSWGYTFPSDRDRRRSGNKP